MNSWDNADTIYTNNFMKSANVSFTWMVRDDLIFSPLRWVEEEWRRMITSLHLPPQFEYQPCKSKARWLYSWQVKLDWRAHEAAHKIWSSEWTRRAECSIEFFVFGKKHSFVRFSLPDYLVVFLNAFDQLLLVLSLNVHILSVRPVLINYGRVISQGSLLSGLHNGRYVLMQ